MSVKETFWIQFTADTKSIKEDIASLESKLTKLESKTRRFFDLPSGSSDPETKLRKINAALEKMYRMKDRYGTETGGLFPHFEPDEARKVAAVASGIGNLTNQKKKLIQTYGEFSNVSKKVNQSLGTTAHQFNAVTGTAGGGGRSGGINGFNDGMSNANKRMQEVNKSGGILNTTFGKFTVIMSGIAASLFVFQEIRRVISALIKSITDFEKAMASLRKETKSTEEDIKRFGEAAKQVQQSGLIKAPEAIEFLRELSSQGYSAGEALNSLKFHMNDLSDLSSGEVTSAIAELGGAFRNLWQDITDLVNGPMANFFKGIADVVNWRGKPSDAQDMQILGNQMRGYQLALSRDGLSSEKKLEIEKKLNAIYAQRAVIIGKQVAAENIPDTFISKTAESRNADARQFIELQKKAEKANKKLAQQSYQQTKSMLTREESLYIKEAQNRVKTVYKEFQTREEIAKKSGRQLFGLEDDYRKKVEGIYLDLAEKLNKIDQKKLANKKRDLSDELKALNMGEGFDKKNYNYIISSYKQQLEDERKKTLASLDEKINSNALGLAKKEPQANYKKTAEQIKEAYDTMYGDLENKSSQYYNYELSQLEDQRDKFILLTNDQYTAYKWFADQKFDLDRKMLDSSNSFTDGMRSGLIDIIESSRQYGAQAKDFTLSTFSSMEDAVVGFVETGKLSFRDLAQSIISDLARIAAHQIFGQIAKVALGSLGNGAGITDSALEEGLSLSWTGGSFHRGGIVGSSLVPQRSIDASLMAFAPRLHSGLAPDEYPAILQRGEEVIPKDKSGSGDTYITNNITAIDTQSFSEYVRRNPGAIIETVNRDIKGRGMLRSTIKGAM